MIYVLIVPGDTIVCFDLSCHPTQFKPYPVPFPKADVSETKGRKEPISQLIKTKDIVQALV
jgi:hypothetical protein